MGEHTPGPWDREGVWALLRHANKCPSCAGVEDCEGLLPTERHADLVTAAPDLLAALEEILRFAEEEGTRLNPDIGRAVASYTNARTAIARARGQGVTQ